MSWLLISLIAQIILGTASVFDKLLLKKSYPNPVGYTFWIAILGLVSVFLLPFGFEWISGSLILYALWGGALFIIALLLFYGALYYGEASGAVVAIGGLSPVVTFLFSYLLIGSSLTNYELVSFLFLIMGSFLLSFTAQQGARLRVFSFVVASAILFGYSNIVSKQIFEATTFFTGFFWLKIGGVVVALLLLGYRPWREAILHPSAGRWNENTFSHKGWYFANRVYAGVGSFLIYYAIALGVPSLIDAMQAVRFLFVFAGGWLLLRETFRGKVLVLKIVAFAVISAGILLLGTGEYVKNTTPDPNRSIEWGVTFSQKFSSELHSKSGGWQENYDAILYDLGVRHLRLIAYWDLIEPQENVYDFSGLDYQMRRAEEVDADVILVMGRKVPRWPECHTPLWAERLELKAKNEKLLYFISEVVKRYKNSSALRYWQVENEPFLSFGDCPSVSRDRVDAEISHVRLLDASHPILITDSGELGLWYAAAKRGDVFGTTMYRRVYNEVLGFFEYPIGPWFFRIKEHVVRFLIQDYKKEFVVIELGMEPWLPRALRDAPLEDQLRVFDFAFFQDSIRFAKDTGFDSYYMWGAEWWYWMKVQHNDPRFWDVAQELFTQKAPVNIDAF